MTLVITVRDGVSFNPARSQFMKDFLAQNLPDGTVLGVDVDYPKGSPLTREEVTDDLAKKIKSALLEDDRVVRVVFGTHGGFRPATRYNLSLTSMYGLGMFGDGFISETFKTVLDSFKDHVVPQLRITLDSCLTFCGSEKDAAKRAEFLMAYLGAPDGAIYGAKWREAFAGSNYGSTGIGDHAVRQIGRRLAIAALFSVNWQALLSRDFKLREVFKPKVYQLASLFKDLNEGRLVILRNGKVERTVNVTRKKDLLEIYGIPNCAEAVRGQVE